MAMPVCECGSVPVARRLIVRGVHPAAGIAFMLAAPVINPIVLLSTAVAYSGPRRAGDGARPPALGLVRRDRRGHDDRAQRRRAPLVAHAREHEPAHDHDHRYGRVRGFVDHLMSDLLLMGKFIVLGAAIAAALQTIVPQSVFTGVLTSPFVGALLMIVLAFFLSLCSEADAFVAVSFIQFPPGPQLAFLAAGPVLDTKLVLLYGGAFGRAFVLQAGVGDRARRRGGLNALPGGDLMSWDWTRTLRALAHCGVGRVLHLSVGERARDDLHRAQDLVGRRARRDHAAARRARLPVGRARPAPRPLAARVRRQRPAGRADPAHADGPRPVARRARRREQAHREGRGAAGDPDRGEIRLFEIAWAKTRRNTRR